MVSILIVEKNGSIKSTDLKKYNEDELYKKAGFKTNNEFIRQNIWTLGSNVNIHLFGKTTGRAGQENKYDFPPPIDNKLFFGSCILVNYTDDGKVLDLSTKQWDVVYEKLFGGFEDLGDEDSIESYDEDDDDNSCTKEGYSKDGFVVEDDEEDDEDEDYEDEDYEDEAPKKKKKPIIKKSIKNPKSKKNESENIIESELDNCYLGCTSELTEEEYV